MTPSMIRLPIDAEIPKILGELKNSINLVLVASPGAGKTTRVPAAIMKSDLLKSDARGIIMLEPRRLAARASAARIATENNWKLGEEVGYQVRFENRTSPRTQLTVMTEGLLSRKLSSDPELKGIGCVILDEFHERSWHSDIGLGLLRELQELSRSDLKIIVMSATLQAGKISAYLGDCPIVDVKAQAHPIHVQNLKEPQLLTTGPDFTDRVSKTIDSVLKGEKESRGDLLVFLPGMREITNVAGSISSAIERAGAEVHLLHGSLRIEDQDRAIQPSTRKKVILSTNIAETSLTIDGVGTVIDSGLARVNRQDANGFPKLELSRISLFSAVQRTGRSGRQGVGYSYRLWNKMDEASMPETETPEIKRIDLAEAALLLSTHGIVDWENFSWFERPPLQALQAAMTLLINLQAVKLEDGLPRITEIGTRLLRWPMHPRLARIMEGALGSDQLIESAACLTALVSERDILFDAGSMRGKTNSQSDIEVRIDLLNSDRNSSLDRAAVASVRRAQEQVMNLATRHRQKNSAARAARNISELLLLGFPDRVCRRRKPGAPEARMVGGKGIKLSQNSSVTQAELFIAVDAVTLQQGNQKNDATVTLAASVSLENLKNIFPQKVKVQRTPALDTASGKVVLNVAEYYEDLALEEPRIAPASQDDVMAVLPELVANSWQDILERNEIARAWLDRYSFLKASLPDEEWPAFEIEDRTHPKVRELIESITLGEKSPKTLFEKDFKWALEELVGSSIAQLMQKEAPESVQVPTGNRIKVHYPPPPRQPYIEVRLQEVFGWTKGPYFARGKVPLVLHLLGPNYRPVQVTQDLASFWSGSYADVRKELRARYPKHSWPDDPLQAKPEAKGRPRK